MTESNDLEDKLDEAIKGVEKKLEEKTTVKERGFYEEFAKTQDITNLKRPVYVIHEHHSSRLHWDLRFEDGGVMRTWRLYKSPPQTGNKILAPALSEVRSIVLAHVMELHLFYGDFKGVMIARKHVSWYIQYLVETTTGFSAEFTIDQGKAFRAIFNALASTDEQLATLGEFFDGFVTGRF